MAKELVNNWSRSSTRLSYISSSRDRTAAVLMASLLEEFFGLE
jgi:hypothetical protein